MLELGDLRVEAIESGSFSLDGGAMFGVVPRTLWEKHLAPDSRNRVRLALRCLLVRAGDRVALIDTGIGDRWDARSREVYALDGEAPPARANGQLAHGRGPAANDRAPATDRAATDRAATDRAATDRAPALGGVPANDRPTLASELAARGLAPGDVTDVVLTHLHFDHAGGVTRPDGTLAFPRARHHLQRRNWEWAQHPTERDRGSYRVESFAALSGSDRLELIDGEREILPGLRVLPTDGHTPGLQCVRLEGGGRSLLYPADLIPTAAHLKSSWAMSYDLAPLAVLREKRALLEWAARDGSVVVFEHDPRLAACTVRAEKREFVVDREIQL